MLSNVDRFGHFDIRLGDTARFPLDRLGNREVYNRTFQVVAFGGQGKRHCLLVRRRHDGFQNWIASHWFDAYANPYLKGGRCWNARIWRRLDARPRPDLGLPRFNNGEVGGDLSPDMIY